MARNVFTLICKDRDSAEEIAEAIDAKGLVVERFGERSRRRHRKSSAIISETLLVNVTGEDVDLAVIQQDLTALSQRFDGVRLLL